MLHLFPSYSMNISRITNVIAGGEVARTTAQTANSSCHDMIRTQILNCSQSCMNRIVGTTVQFQPGQNPTILCLVQVTTPPGPSGSGFWTGLELNRTIYRVQTRNAGVLPRPITNTTDNAHAQLNYLSNYRDIVITIQNHDYTATALRW